ncbi:hypothetical protein [Clostridium sp. KNHs214]|uniref:hypothetical protein n=1 Tax=Clostridium sp. KNHs214 TaxID=1540257 RepID=UPI000552955D|nr:hypothetical protein [Clostridium sp. KNHs214]
MAKPSIFSKHYEKAVKKRRKKMAAVIISVVFILGIVMYINLSKNKGFNIINKINKINKKTGAEKVESKKTVNSKKEDKDKKQNTPVKKENETKYITVNLNENLIVKISYEEKENKKIYKDVVKESDNSKIYYDANPSKTALVVYEEKTQKIFFIDNQGKVLDISKEQYVSKSGNVFLRENKIKEDSNYLWCQSPRFVDEENIVFISRLPWLKTDGKKFIWYGKVGEKKYKYIRNKQGEDVQFQNITQKGLAVKIDDKIYYVTSDGTLSE